MLVFLEKLKGVGTLLVGVFTEEHHSDVVEAATVNLETQEQFQQFVVLLFLVSTQTESEFEIVAGSINELINAAIIEIIGVLRLAPLAISLPHTLPLISSLSLRPRTPR